MTKPYGGEGEEQSYFTYSAFLVLNNRVVTMCMALFLAWRSGEGIAPVAPLWTYAAASISNFCATWCQYEALRYVSFPTQTLGKCGKVIPILVLGTLGLGVKKYGKQEYVEGLLVTLGCFIFAMSGEIKASVADRSDSTYGIMLMFGYLFCDGFTSTIQEKVFKTHKPSSTNLMIYVNACSAVFSIATLVSAKQLWPALEFAEKYPQLWVDAFGLSICAMIGQRVIYAIIKNYGALIFGVAMTTRQFVAILLSCVIYVHPLTSGQWVGFGVIVCTMYYKISLKHKAAQEKKAQQAREDIVNKVHVAVGDKSQSQ